MNPVHPLNENIKVKLNYFLEYFEFVNNQIENLHFFEIENHLSLIEKLIFQIEYNTKKEKNRNYKYIYNHLNHKDFQLKLFRKKYNEFLVIESLFENKRNLKESDWNKWIFNEKANIIVQLNSFKENLDQTYYNFIVSELEKILSCQHKISYHLNEINILTKLLVAELRFKGVNSKKAIKILESFTNSEIKFKEIITPKINELFFITKIYDLRSHEQIDFNLGDVRFISITNDQFKPLFDDVRYKTFLPEYVEDTESVVAFQKLEYFDINTAKSIFISNVKNKIDFLNLTYDYYLSVNPSTILTTKDFKSFSYAWQKKFSPKQYINNREKVSINNYSYNILKESHSRAKYEFLQADHIFQSALLQSSISLYWQYLENLFWINENDNTKLQDKLSTILLLNYKERLYNILRNTFINTLANKQSYSSPEYQEIFSISYNRNNIRKLKPYIKTEFEKFVYKELNRRKLDYDQLKLHYSRILLEAFEMRNSFVHSGKTNLKSMIKLKEYLGLLIYRFRVLLVAEINKSENDECSLIEIIEQLFVKSNHLLKSKIN